MASHIVKSGESLSVIGAKYKVSWHTIAQINGIKPPYTIYAGQKLQIPSGSTVQAPTNASGGKQPLVPTGAPDMFNSLIAGVLLYGIYKVLMKVF